MNAIEINKVDFGYVKTDKILKALSMHVPKGSIYGFLGPNGAGKTTTLKLLLGLLKMQSGEVKVLDQNVLKHYPQYLQQIGSLIENSSLYGHLSAKNNMRIWAKQLGISESKIPEILEVVGLEAVGKKKAQNFSTGMKQRLGLGISLLHDPDILILDEPTNGLDPIGITELRATLRKLNESGKTILLSSHILSEVEKIVSHVGILKNGALAFEGSIDELQAFLQSNVELVLNVDDKTKAKSILQSYDVGQTEEGLILKIDHINQVDDIIKQCQENGIKIYEVYNQKNDLEKLFMDISQ